MRKITILVALIFISAFTFAQTKQGNSGLKAIHLEKHINNLPASTKAIVDSLHYDGDNSDAIGINAAATFGAYAMFPSALTTAHHANGNTITSVKLFINGATTVTAAAIKIFSDTGVTVLASQVFTAVEGWNEVVLTTPLAIPTTDIYVGYEVTVTGGYPLGIDAATTPVPNANWIDADGSWAHLTDLSATLTGSWNIRAMVDGTALTTPIASCSQNTWAAGDVVVGNSVTSPTISLQNLGGGTLTVSGITGLSAPYTTTLVPATVSLTSGQAATFTFTYAPTVAGAAAQTVVIATNAGNITVNLTGNAIECAAITTLPYTEGFEGSTACITVVDANTDTYTWAYITSAISHGGAVHARYSYNTDGATPGDDWMILPGIQLTAATTYGVTFWHKVYDELYPESFKVAIGSAAAPASLTTTLLDKPAQSDTAWTYELVNFTVPTTGVYFIGFHCYSPADQWRLAIDDITVDFSNGISENNAEVVSVFPNPANDKLFISANHIQTVEIFNLTGARVANYGNQNSINIADLAQGSYLVKVITDNKVTTQKINIVR
jgi:trimeric autotransporter adhesin